MDNYGVVAVTEGVDVPHMMLFGPTEKRGGGVEASLEWEGPLLGGSRCDRSRVLYFVWPGWSNIRKYWVEIGAAQQEWFVSISAEEDLSFEGKSKSRPIFMARSRSQQSTTHEDDGRAQPHRITPRNCRVTSQRTSTYRFLYQGEGLIHFIHSG